MKSSFCLILSLVLIFSCEYKETKSSNSNKNIDATTIIKGEDEKLNFQSFIDNINKDCSYQKKSVRFPLQCISLIDFENNTYDTSEIPKKDYQCMEFTSPKSNIIDGEVRLEFTHLSDREEIILLWVEDTGVHIQYFFTRHNNSWALVKILDEST